MYAALDPPLLNPGNQEEEVEEEEDDDDDDDEDNESDSEAETGRKEADASQNLQAVGSAVAEPSELMQLDMSEDIRLGSPDDGSNNLDSDFHLLVVSQGGNPDDHQRRIDSVRAESSRMWPMMQDDQPLSGTGLNPHSSGKKQYQHFHSLTFLLRSGTDFSDLNHLFLISEHFEIRICVKY